MAWYWTVLVCVLSVLAGAGIGIWVFHLLRKRKRSIDGRQRIRRLLEKHFRPLALDSLIISERKFPFRVRADLQRAIDQHFTSVATITRFCGVRKELALDGINFTSLLVDGQVCCNPASSWKRRSMQFHLERHSSGRIEWEDIEAALEEMLFSGGSLNLKLLGAEGVNGAGYGFRTKNRLP